MLGKSIGINSLILGAFAVLTAGILAMTFINTKDKIAEEERRAAQKALLEIIPSNRHDNDLLSETWEIPSAQLLELGLKESSKIHIAKQNGKTVAVIIPSIAPDGYSGEIKLIIGVNIDGSVAGVRALAHRETPGLGDKVDIKKSTWILDFDGKSLQNHETSKWKVKKDGGIFDQFTGATITPRAVINRVKQTLTFFESHKGSILENGSVQ